ncbi:hypothetical protein RND71_013950 [Anisodus tanguticus]|uniref:Uncharacterized protein n=1 Tax=Anisodus tanguticus TaxID=243964 RepID=A0AAE1VN97_9SOLA|nr:hypothetical protein RND71_013950 [Anisodus tanguticus]
MFVSTLTYPRPICTEATLDFNIVLVGTYCVILSGATNGRAYLNLAVVTLAKINVEVERKLFCKKAPTNRTLNHFVEVERTIMTKGIGGRLNPDSCRKVPYWRVKCSLTKMVSYQGSNPRVATSD